MISVCRNVKRCFFSSESADIYRQYSQLLINPNTCNVINTFYQCGLKIYVTHFFKSPVLVVE